MLISSALGSVGLSSWPWYVTVQLNVYAAVYAVFAVTLCVLMSIARRGDEVQRSAFLAGLLELRMQRLSKRSAEVARSHMMDAKKAFEEEDGGEATMRAGSHVHRSVIMRTRFLMVTLIIRCAMVAALCTAKAQGLPMVSAAAMVNLLAALLTEGQGVITFLFLGMQPEVIDDFWMLIDSIRHSYLVQLVIGDAHDVDDSPQQVVLHGGGHTWTSPRRRPDCWAPDDTRGAAHPYEGGGVAIYGVDHPYEGGEQRAGSRMRYRPFRMPFPGARAAAGRAAAADEATSACPSLFDASTGKGRPRGLGSLAAGRFHMPRISSFQLPSLGENLRGRFQHLHVPFVGHGEDSVADGGGWEPLGDEPNGDGDGRAVGGHSTPLSDSTDSTASGSAPAPPFPAPTPAQLDQRLAGGGAPAVAGQLGQAVVLPRGTHHQSTTASVAC